MDKNLQVDPKRAYIQAVKSPPTGNFNGIGFACRHSFPPAGNNKRSKFITDCPAANETRRGIIFSRNSQLSHAPRSPAQRSPAFAQAAPLWFLRMDSGPNSAPISASNAKAVVTA